MKNPITRVVEYLRRKSAEGQLTEQGRAKLASAGDSHKGEDQTLGYLLGTWCTYRHESLAFQFDDRAIDKFKKLFPETFAMFERGLRDGEKLRQTSMPARPE